MLIREDRGVNGNVCGYLKSRNTKKRKKERFWIVQFGIKRKGIKRDTSLSIKNKTLPREVIWAEMNTRQYREVFDSSPGGKWIKVFLRFQKPHNIHLFRSEWLGKFLKVSKCEEHSIMNLEKIIVPNDWMFTSFFFFIDTHFRIFCIHRRMRSGLVDFRVRRAQVWIPDYYIEPRSLLDVWRLWSSFPLLEHRSNNTCITELLECLSW